MKATGQNRIFVAFIVIHGDGRVGQGLVPCPACGTTTDAYAYGNSVWVDLLTAYNGHAITYDTPGNPTSWYDGATMTWVNGRRLASIGATSAHGAMSFTYDADGLRLTKTVGGVTHRYLWQNGKLVSEAWGDKYLEFFYDEKGVPLSFLYRSSATADVWKYLYVTNLQGDVIGITTPDGESRAVYTYDPFGKPLTATGTMAAINPLRYRGYYYDTESGLYYLKSRYYDPGICRFINADSFASTGQSIVGCNMFAYCNDNPIVCYDPDGSKLWYIDANGDAKPSEIPYYKDFDLIIYYYNINSSMNLDDQALNQGYSSRAKYVPVGSFTELTNALKDVPIGTRNIYLYLHSEPNHLTFYYNIHAYSRQILDDVPRVSISGDIFLFSCHGASFANAFSMATGQTVIATNEGVSFAEGFARISPWEFFRDLYHGEPVFWRFFSPNGEQGMYKDDFVF